MQKIIPSLNGIRAFSIFCVLFAHVQIMNFHLPDGPGGQIGVNIFFIISGFLITYLLLKEEAATGTVSLKQFFIRRSLRIFPVFYFMLLVYLVLQMLGIIYIAPGSWFSSATYTKYFFAKGEHDWETGHIWSLSVEEHFYLVWPFIFFYLKDYRKLFAIVIIAVIPFVRLFSGISIMHLFTRADALMWGCLFALYYSSLQKAVISWPVLVKMIPFAMVLFCLASKKLMPGASTPFRDHFILAFFGSYGMITNISIALVIIISINWPGNLYFLLLNSAPMNYIGKLSYSIYLWQELFFSEKLGFFSSFPINLLFIAIAALLSYYLIEKPFLKIKNRFSEKKAKTQPDLVGVVSPSPIA